MERTLFIGDVHGCFDELIKLLDKVSYRPANDRLIYLGDILNKGEKSLETLNFVKEQNIECILGNNEIGFLDLMENGGYHGSSLVKMKESLGNRAEEFYDWVKKFPLYIEEDFIAVHAGLAPGLKPEECSRRILTTIRTWDGVGKNLNNKEDPSWYELYQGKKTIIYGHYASKGLQVRDKTIGLDSGCVFGGHLSCLEWPSRKLTQVKASKVYLAQD
jgi:hypothetical protein